MTFTWLDECEQVVPDFIQVNLISVEIILLYSFGDNKMVSVVASESPVFYWHHNLIMLSDFSVVDPYNWII